MRLEYVRMNEKDVLCGANSYTQKYYFNPKFDRLPSGIKDELQILCVTYTEEVGGALTMAFNEDGELELDVDSDERDYLFDEIGSVLKVKQMRMDNMELFEALELFYQTFYME
jgi:hypothetical protein